VESDGVNYGEEREGQSDGGGVMGGEGVMEGEGMGCWAVVVDCGRLLSRSGGSSSAICTCHLLVGARCCLWEAVSVVCGRRAVVCGWWGSLPVLGIVCGR
jgi:hypothetical protein